jgi:hypothetical protein
MRRMTIFFLPIVVARDLPRVPWGKESWPVATLGVDTVSWPGGVPASQFSVEPLRPCPVWVTTDSVQRGLDLYNTTIDECT